MRVYVALTVNRVIEVALFAIDAAETVDEDATRSTKMSPPLLPGIDDQLTLVVLPSVAWRQCLSFWRKNVVDCLRNVFGDTNAKSSTNNKACGVSALSSTVHCAAYL